MMWHMTEYDLPEETGLYLVTMGTENYRHTGVLAFIKRLEDWDSYGNPEEYYEETYENGQYVNRQIQFPVWYTMRGWEAEETYPSEFYYETASPPFAWAEMPKPCNGIDDIYQDEYEPPEEFELDLNDLMA